MRLVKTDSSRKVWRGCRSAALAITLLVASVAVGASEATRESGAAARDSAEPVTGAKAEIDAVNALLRDLSSGVGGASRVTEVHAVALEEGTLIEIRGDGRFSLVEDFVIENPTRLVVDLPGLSSAVQKDHLVIGSPHAQQIRVGEHADKVRIVVDAGQIQDAFGERQILPVEEGLMIVIGSAVAFGDPGAAVVALEQSANADNEEITHTAEPVQQKSAAVPKSDSQTPAAPDFQPDVASTSALTEREAPIAQAAAGSIRPRPLAVSNSPVFLALAPQAEVQESAQPSATETKRTASVQARETETKRTAPAEPSKVQTKATTAATTTRVQPPASMPLATTVYGVEYEGNTLRDRIVVVGERALEYKVYSPDPETFVLSLEGAAIDPDAAVRIAPEDPGPVSLITAFEQPDVARPEVRVVVKRAAGLMPEISRQGTSLQIDFPRGGAIAVIPPVLTMEPPTTVASVTSAAKSTAAQQARAEEVQAPAQSRQAPAPRSEATSDARPAPAARAPMSAPAAELAAAPAAMEPPSAISILSEGGLMDGKEYVGRRISLDFKDVPIDDVLRLIAEVSDLNVIAGDEVDGTVTVRLVDVPWDQALDVVLLTHGLGFVRVGNVLRIAPTTSIAEEEELRLQERRAKERLEDLMVKLQPVNYADVKKISSMVGQLLTPRGTVNVDERTNTLIIKDIPSVIDEATALVKAVDTMTPQVMIEAKIVEANIDFSRELGTVWGFGANPDRESSIGGRDFTPFGGTSGVAFANPITSAATGLFGLGAHVFDEKFNVDLQLRAAESNGDGKVISSPRIVTLDNSEASIEQGVSIPFQTFENGDAQLEFVDAVLQLKVTPHITADQSIIMDIEVSRNAPDDSVFTLTGSPAIAKNQVKTETLVKDGQTLVLGGIYVIDKSDRQSRVPYLSRIPLLGAAFKSNEVSDSRKELLIFVTPRVVQTQDAAS